jgi:hypothetical protein
VRFLDVDVVRISKRLSFVLHHRPDRPDSIEEDRSVTIRARIVTSGLTM